MLTASTHAAVAQELGSPAPGLIYAKERCADCHAVDRHSSHNTMPNLVVQGDNLNDLIAYIRSLKAPPASKK
jgi:cytochrome c2